MNNEIVTFYETKAFIKRASKLLGDDLMRALKLHLATYPKSGDVIPGGDGIRKLRWALPNVGKRGGARVIYFYLNEKGLISLLTIYAKSEKENLEPSDLKELVKLATLIRSSL